MKIAQAVVQMQDAGWYFEDFESSATGKKLAQEDLHCDVEAEHATGCSVIHGFGTFLCVAFAASTGPLFAALSGCAGVYSGYYAAQGVRTRTNIKQLAQSIQDNKKTIFYLEQIKKVVTGQINTLLKSTASTRPSQSTVMKRHWKALSNLVPLFRDDFPHHSYVKLNNCQKRTVEALRVLKHDASREKLEQAVAMMQELVGNQQGGILDELIGIRQKMIDHQEGELNSWIQYNREQLALKKSTS